MATTTKCVRFIRKTRYAYCSIDLVDCLHPLFPNFLLRLFEFCLISRGEIDQKKIEMVKGLKKKCIETFRCNSYTIEMCKMMCVCV